MNPNPFLDMTRRQFLGRSSTGIGAAALASLMNPQLSAAQGIAGLPHFAPKAKRVIWLTQAGAPSQLDLFDYKPGLRAQYNKDLPNSVRNGQRVTGMTSNQARFPIAPSIFTFKQYGKAGHWLSELLPHTAHLADDLCIIRSMHTDAINHDPGMTLLQTGSQVAGRPSFGSWLSYGLGSDNAELPAFVVMVSRPSGNGNAQPLHERMWGSGFLSPRYQGVRFSAGKDPVLFLANSPGITPERRRAMLDDIAGLNKIKLDDYQDPEIQARIDQYEMAFVCSHPSLSLPIYHKSPHPSSNVTAPNRASPAAMRRTAFSHAGSPSVVCASSNSITVAGISTAICRLISAASVMILTNQAPPWSGS